MRALVVVALSAWVLACSSTTENSSGGTGGASGCANGSTVCKQDSTGCCACGVAKCQVQNEACLCNASCVSTMICVAGCTSTLCVEACENDHPDAGVTFSNLKNCAVVECPTECTF